MNNTFRKYDVDWGKEIEEFKASGIPMRKFCEKKNYNKGIFAYHYYREKNTGDAMTEYSDNETVFIPVRVVEWEPSVITVNGFRITVTEDTDVPALRTVLKAIGDISWN